MIIIISTAILIIFCILAFLAWKKNHHITEGINRKSHQLYFLYPLSYDVRKKFVKYKLISSNDSIEKSIGRLQVGNETENSYENYWNQKISLVFVILALCLVLMIAMEATKSLEPLLEGAYLTRPKIGEGSKEVSLEVDLELFESNGEDTGDYRTTLELEIDPKLYLDEEIDGALQDGLEEILKLALGNNLDYSRIETNLNFIQKIPNTHIKVKYKPENHDLIQGDGSILNDEIELDGETTWIMFYLTVQGRELTHRQEVHVLPKGYTREEEIEKSLIEAVERAKEDSKQEEMLKLPQEVRGYRIQWKVVKENNSLLLLFLGLVTAVVVWIYCDKEIDKRMKVRKTQMLLDYPEIIHKFTLLLNAGMTIRQAWLKIVEDYEYQKDKRYRRMGYAFEEMRITSHEIQLGVPEELAYDQFGKRVGVLPYLKLSSFIAQNLKKGNKGLIESLTREGIEAMEERKLTIKRLGEEAGTKLLIPMMILLILIFIIIMIPAFITLGI